MRGTVVGGKYRIEDRLGEGGMGTVWSAEHTETGRRVAVKLLVPHAQSAEAALRFSREARAASAACGEHVVQVLDAGTDAEHGPYLVLERLDGEDARSLLERLGPLPPPLALRIVHHALSGLERAHRAGIVHRDIKPANLFLARADRDRRIVKILDFGIAKLLAPDDAPGSLDLTGTGAMLGSPKYMSPEQVQGLRTLDHRADLWSLGVVLYKLLTGQTPHEDVETQGQLVVAICTVPARPVREVAPWIRSRCGQVADRALALDPAERFADAAAMRDAVRDALDGADPAIEEASLQPLAEEDRRLAPPSVRKPTGAPPASSETRVGGAPSIEARVGEAPSSETRVGEAPSIETAAGLASQARPARPGGLRVGSAVAAAAAVVAAVVALRASSSTGAGAPSHGSGESAASAVAPRAAATNEARPDGDPAGAPAPAAVREAGVLVPRGARVEVDGVVVEAQDGRVPLRGALGSVHRVRVSLGARTREQDVAIAEAGAIPAEIALPSAAPAPKSSAAPAGELDVRWPGSKEPAPPPR